jgi:dienelactone hydrolase
MDELTPSMTYDSADPAAWRTGLRAKVAELTGLRAMLDQPRCDLNVRTLWRREHERGTIEKIAFTPEPSCDATAYLCLPKGATGKLPWFVCLQGHSSGMHLSIGVDAEDETADIDVEGDRDFGLGCMQRGIAALCLEQRCFGEREEHVVDRSQAKQSRCHDGTLHALMLGRTMLGERVYDVDRAIDYLLTRNDVDATRLGVMGNSGGGTVSLFSAATLDRVTHAMPSCYFCTFRASIMSLHHCEDNYVPGLMPVAEMADILGTFAPKPVVCVAGEQDEIFPIEATRSEFERLQRIYADAGASDNCRLVVGEGGHRFYAEAGWQAMLPMLGL